MRRDRECEWKDCHHEWERHLRVKLHNVGSISFFLCKNHALQFMALKPSEIASGNSVVNS